VCFLTPFFKPPCAFDVIWTVRIAILNWTEKSFELGVLIYDFRYLRLRLRLLRDAHNDGGLVIDYLLLR
jgi:hypothetical protein